MGIIRDILGYQSAPIVSERHENIGYKGNYYSAADDDTDWDGTFVNSSHAISDRIVPHARIPDGPDLPGNSLFERQAGSYNLIPGRAISAQTRLKNLPYELPAYGWTKNPEIDPFIPQVPGLPKQTINLPTVTNYTTQPEFLQPITNLQIQNDLNWMARFRAAIFGQAQATVAQNQQNMFPSIFDPTFSTGAQ